MSRIDRQKVRRAFSKRLTLMMPGQWCSRG